MCSCHTQCWKFYSTGNKHDENYYLVKQAFKSDDGEEAFSTITTNTQITSQTNVDSTYGTAKTELTRWGEQSYTVVYSNGTKTTCNHNKKWNKIKQEKSNTCTKENKNIGGKRQSNICRKWTKTQRKSVCVCGEMKKKKYIRWKPVLTAQHFTCANCHVTQGYGLKKKT